MHHNEKDGQIIGRVHSVEYTEVNTRGNTPALIFTVNVGDEDGKKGIKNGTLSTVSIGVIAHDLRCSICGTNLAEDGLCEHEKGEFYEVEGEQQLCYWIIEKMEPKEVSYVIVPSDAYAHNLKVYDAVKKKKSEVKESVENNNPFAELIEATKVKSKVEDTKEGKQIDEEVEKGSDVSKPEEEEAKEPETKETSEDETPEGHEDPAGEAGDIDNSKNKDENTESKEGEEPESKNPEEDDEKSEEENKDKNEDPSEEENEELKLAKEKITALEKELKTVKDEKAKLENKLEKVTETKESVERELVQFKAEKKKALVETITNLRSQLSLPKEDETILMESSEESLKLTVKSLNEFSQVQKVAYKGLQTLSSPVAVSESKDNTVVEKSNKNFKNVKESLKDSNKSLEDQMKNLMENIF